MTHKHATPEATKNVKGNHPNLQYNQLSDTNLWVSEAGFGTYRTEESDENHQESLKQALSKGINLIDTSSNYMNGSAERLIGQTLLALKNSQTISREEIVIVSKGGYIQGSNYEDSQERKKEGTPYPELTELSEGLEHCIHPEFLEDQITKSLNRLQVDCIDVYLLHNPEYFLKWAHHAAIENAHDQYYTRLENAFAHLENEVKMGRINYYGISSNTFPSSSKNPEFTGLETLLEKIKKEDREHFKVIQLPFNLYETGAATEENQTNNKTVLDVAQENNIAVLINRPLNAFFDNQLYRLADIQISGTITSEDALFNHIADLEQEEEKLQSLLSDDPTDIQLKQLLHLSPIIQETRSSVSNITQWQDILLQYINPRLDYCAHMIHEKNEEKLISWFENTLILLKDIFEGISNLLKEKKVNDNESLIAKLHHACPDWSDCTSLTQLAIRYLRKTRGVTSTLIGMRHPQYVKSVINELETDTDIDVTKEKWNAIKESLSQ